MHSTVDARKVLRTTKPDRMLPPERGSSTGAGMGDSLRMERTILLAHEDPDCRRIYRTALEYAGWYVRDTENGDAALELLSSERIDAVVSDLFVRGTGDDLLVRRIRSVPAAAHIPIVVLTGWGSTEHEVFALREGADEFLVMPVTPQRLVDVLKTLVARDALPVDPPRQRRGDSEIEVRP